MGIERIPVRAKIIFGNTTISTPYVLSFSVNKQRGSYSTFSASLKVKSHSIRGISGKVVIFAGRKDNLKKIFTGIVKKKIQTPCWDDPSYQTINVSGADELCKLEGMKITRRQFISDTSWAKITSVSPGLKSGKLKLTNKGTISPNSGGIPDKELGIGSEAPSNTDNSAGDRGETTPKRPPIVGNAEFVENY